MREKWRESFGQWYNEIIEKAEILDLRYPIKGVYVWLPYGFKVRRYVVEAMRQMLEEKGHEEVLFPMLIPEQELAKEAEHIKGFEDEVYWVTHGGRTPLEVDLALRPTSESAIYPVYSLWVRSHTDFPIKLYQVVNTFRYETKATKPLIRLREITTFKEAHSVHGSYEDAEKQVEEAVEIYSQFFRALGVPFVVSRRPDWDKFPGAEYTLAFDTVFPNGKALQLATVHQLGQNFSQTFEVTFENLEGEQEYAYQTCYGISDRVIAALLAVHGDDRGLCLIPEFAPIQVVIVPIWKKGEVERINTRVEEVKDMLSSLRVKVDYRDIRPGKKFYDWEIRGVPIRLELGAKDIERGEVTLVRRDSGEKFQVGRDEVVGEVKKALKEVESELERRAEKMMEESFFSAHNIQEVREVVEEKRGVASVSWCGSESCGEEIEGRANVEMLGILEEEPSGECIGCKGKAQKTVMMGRSY